MKLLKAKNYEKMQWKNNKGSTREIAKSVNNTGNINWRLSIATITEDCPFSIFENLDRSIALLDGKKLTLVINEDKKVVLTQTSDAFSFDGASGVEAFTSFGNTTDLNVMTMRGVYRHTLQHIIVNQFDVLKGLAQHNFIIANHDCLIICHDKILNIHRYDTICFERDEDIIIRASSETLTIFLITIHLEET